MSGDAVTILLERDEAMVLDACLDRMFGNKDLHDWEDVRLSLEQECEQWPFFAIREALADQLNSELTSTNYDQLLEQSRKSITARVGK